MFWQAPVTNKCTLNSSLRVNIPGTTDQQHDKHDKVTSLHLSVKKMFWQAPVTNKCTLNSSLRVNIPGTTDQQHDKHDEVKEQIVFNHLAATGPIVM